MDIHRIAQYGGLVTVAATHVYMLNTAMSEAMRHRHAAVNPGAADAILYAV